MSELCALDVGGEVEEPLTEFVAVDSVCVGSVVEEQSHQMAVVFVLFVEVSERWHRW